MKKIPLGRGYYAKVDNSDFPRTVKVGAWHVQTGRNTLYAGHTINTYINNVRKTKTILLHRFILHADRKMKVDHKNRNGLDCQKKNLRNATNRENTCNSRPRKGCSSRYKGVYWHKRSKAWAAKINTQGKQKHLGYFSKEIDAAKAYDVFAKKHFGRFAYTNFKEKKNV